MSSRLKASLLALVLAGVVLWCIPVASASLLRQVRVTVRNDSPHPIVVGSEEAGTEGLKVKFHNQGSSQTLEPKHDFVAATGAHDYRQLVIATACRGTCVPDGKSCGIDAVGLLFDNPILGYPDVSEVQARPDGFWVTELEGPSPHSKRLGVGESAWFWKSLPGRPGAVLVTRHKDSADFIEFTESILRNPCSR